MSKKTISVFDALIFGAAACERALREDELESQEIDEFEMLDESNYHGE